MMATSAGVEVKASTQGGVMKGLKRSFLGGESLFITTFTAPDTGGWVDVAHHLAGDIITAGVTADQPMSITKGCWLASSVGVDLDTKWGGFKNLFGGEGGFLIHATGLGTVLLACYGALDTLSLGDGRSRHHRQWSRRGVRPEGEQPAPQGDRRRGADAEVGRRTRLRLHRPGLGDDAVPQPVGAGGLDPPGRTRSNGWRVGWRARQPVRLTRTTASVTFDRRRDMGLSACAWLSRPRP